MQWYLFTTPQLVHGTDLSDDLLQNRVGGKLSLRRGLKDSFWLFVKVKEICLNRNQSEAEIHNLRRPGSLNIRRKERLLYGRCKEWVFRGSRLERKKFTSRLSGLGNLWRSVRPNEQETRKLNKRSISGGEVPKTLESECFIWGFDLRGDLYKEGLMT